jgi:hypothetical protein
MDYPTSPMTRSKSAFGALGVPAVASASGTDVRASKREGPPGPLLGPQHESQMNESADIPGMTGMGTLNDLSCARRPPLRQSAAAI